MRQGLYLQVSPTLGRYRKAAMHHSPRSPSFPYLAHWLSVVSGICLAACVQSPQAAVSANAMPPVAMVWDTGTGSCVVGERLRTAVASVRTVLRAQGMALKTSCQAGQGALGVRVDVVDGLLASAVVRGPLAEGEPVDMGTPAGGDRREGRKRQRGCFARCAAQPPVVASADGAPPVRQPAERLVAFCAPGCAATGCGRSGAGGALSPLP